MSSEHATDGEMLALARKEYQAMIRPKLSAKSRAALKRVRNAVKESRARMNTYTEEQRAELERQGRARIAAGARKQ